MIQLLRSMLLILNNLVDTVTCISDYRLVNRFIDNLHVVTTNNYYTIADFHTTNHSTLSILNLLSLVFTW
jgi:hypothetical protein